MSNNNKNNNLFIKTSDEDTMNLLVSEGFELLNYSNGIWTFINDTNRLLTFNNNKMAYSNMLTFQTPF